MDRYQFEDLVSDYIENKLSLSKRKEFELYLNQNPEAQSVADSLRSTLTVLHNLPPVKTSPDFMVNLKRRIELEKSRPSRRLHYGRTIMGLTPAYAGLMTVVLVAMTFVVMEFIPSRDTGQPPGQVQYTNTPQLNTVAPISPADSQTDDLLVQSEEDSVITDDLKDRPDIDFRDRIRFVKDKP